VRLFQARSSNLAGEPLDIDGVVGPETWTALFGASAAGPGVVVVGPPPPGGIGATVIEIAKAEIGVRESPIGSNRGPRVDQYLEATGYNPASDS